MSGSNKDFSFWHWVKLVIFCATLIKLSDADSSCNYYPRYPDITYSLTQSCPNGCCGGPVPVRSSDACCFVSSTPSWIAYPIVCAALLITGSVIFVVCCTKKPKMFGNRAQAIRQSWVSPAYPGNQGNLSPINSPYPINQPYPTMTNPVYNMNIYTHEQSPAWWSANGSGTNEAPPKYDELKFLSPTTTNNNNQTIKADNDQLMPVLPGCFIPPEEIAKSNEQRIDTNNSNNSGTNQNQSNKQT